MIKNVILDMGNVLLKYDPELALDAYCTSETEKDIIRREYFYGPEWVMSDLGDITSEERVRRVKERIPELYHEVLEHCADHWIDYLSPVDGAKDFCEYVKKKGYGIYVLSNASTQFYDYFPHFSELEYFDGVVVSADLHIIKPDPRIYEYILEKYELKADECVFIDDLEANIKGAEALGINGYVFRGDFGDVVNTYKL